MTDPVLEAAIADMADESWQIDASTFQARADEALGRLRTNQSAITRLLAILLKEAAGLIERKQQ